jgi:hypothetical protein
VTLDFEEMFPNIQPEVLEIAAELRNLILRMFPAAVVTVDIDNVGFGFGSGYKDLVFVISPYREHVNLGIVNGAVLQDSYALMQGTVKVHRHVKLKRVEQFQDPHLEELMLAALQTAKEGHQKGT